MRTAAADVHMDETAGRRLRRRAAPASRARVAVAAIISLAVAGSAGPAEADNNPDVLFTYADERISESSGLAASAVHPGVVYTHNDSEDTGRIFAVTPDGETAAVITVRDVVARDWEAIALGTDEDGRSAIYIADIGDNLDGYWPEVWIYRIPEPDVLADTEVAATAYEFTYEDGPRNAEAMLVDPRDNRIYVVSKQVGGGGIYRGPETLSTRQPNVLERIADAPGLVTDGAFAPDGSHFVLRDYFAAHFFVTPGNEIRSVALPLSFQGEAITFTPEGDTLLVGSEGQGSAVWRVPIEIVTPLPPKP